MERDRAVVSLIVASGLAAWMSHILVGAAEGTGQSLGMSQVFIGMVFIAIVGGAAESGSAIAMARKNKWICRLDRAGKLYPNRLVRRPVLGVGQLFHRAAAAELSFGRTEIGASLWPF